MEAWVRKLVTGCLLTLPVAASAVAASEQAVRVAVIGNSPPMSYVDESGKLTGFNVEMAHALCATMKIRCNLLPTSLDKVVDAVSAGEMDFAVVSLLATPERRKKVLFSKPYYRSLSIWLSKPSIKPGSPRTTVAVVNGSVQAQHAENQGWKTKRVTNHREISTSLVAGDADATVVPMLTAVSLMEKPSLQALGLESTVLSDPLISGDVCISIHPGRPELREQIDAALDEIKRDGRFDRINSQFLPFRLL
ncbi:MAG: amino acid ABC transporter substrate-binding protein [Betaproteobacteria bacterium]|uniref:Amino acid ABC transporter substrate-binding protein n=1 Tax=Candidatus Proximibacter danicus TaxID=2954365 RepID=A0A9D7K242_9PROT|nr:amino acid ABC transporter substrate-binding protein [Candidatus Proximibacter danicus]MBK9447064.1 amino acid ABC transporter substrate-binding protein [Betaproteobacteria bacterium]